MNDKTPPPRWSQRRLSLEFMNDLNWTTTIELAEPPARRPGPALNCQAAKYIMKYTILISMMAVCIVAAGCGKKAPPYRGPTVTQSVRDGFVAQEKKFAESCQVIAYASADTNQIPNVVLTVSEIWKGARDSSTLGVTNGTQFILDGNSPSGTLPDGGVVFIPWADSPSIAFQQREVIIVRSGRVLDMTVQEFKKRLGF